MKDEIRCRVCGPLTEVPAGEVYGTPSFAKATEGKRAFASSAGGVTQVSDYSYFGNCFLTDSSQGHSRNAHQPISFTLDGIVTLVRLVHP